MMLGCPWDYSDPIAGLIEFPFLPRPRISADVRFSADVFSAPFWVSSFGAASVQLLSLRFCCLCVPPSSEEVLLSFPRFHLVESYISNDTSVYSFNKSPTQNSLEPSPPQSSPTEPSPNITSRSHTLPTQNPPLLQVYSRKKKLPETILQSTTCRELDMDSVATIDDTLVPSKSSSLIPNAVIEDDSDASKPSQQNLDAFPIAIRKRKRAVEEELAALEKNTTWTVTDLPPGKEVVGCKWIFGIKFNLNGSVQWYKARLVAKGFTQTHGIDFTETFAPVAKLNTVRVLLSIAVNNDWSLHQLDVKNAFLNGHLDEEVYMKIPPGLQTLGGSKKLCRLHKSLYGLKQSPWAWFEQFTRVIVRNRYKQSLADHTLFIKKNSNGKKAILLVYVDDIIITGDDDGEISRLKELLNSEFETKDLGPLRYFLGMEVARSTARLVISQRKYVLDLLKEADLLGCKPTETLMDINLKFGSTTSSFPHKDRFQRIVGKLIYLSLTRPDIAFPVNVLSQHMSDPNEENMAATYRVLRYLKQTPGHGLIFKKSSYRSIEVFTDSSWAGDLTDRRSTSGYCTFLWGNLVTWRTDYFELLSDNNSAIQIAKNLVQHDRTKHVEINRHFIAEKIKNGTAKLFYIPSDGQLADILTKALPKPAFDSFKCKLGIYNVYTPA
ncbi:hypothetical protein V6N12_046360 [Hibiscus sabdariffa]|uniref:Reverse transcriptase Ty1/copia-type domain-containing protein n=1 Tax=Hibiscus sabdariffa TaxID=183260 RepID=A0ABR2DK08_9ROSI